MFGEKGRLRDISFAKETRRASRDKRQSFTDPQIVTLLRGTSDETLRDLILLGAFTGARIEEICSLKLDDVTGDRFNITDSKTSAGIRSVPIHPKLQQTVQRLVDTSTDGYLLPGLNLDKYGKRSNAIGLRFSKLKTRLGMDGRYVFHSLRKSFIGKLENAGIPENIAARLAGHEITSMSYGVYSTGVSFDVLKDAVQQVSFEGMPATF